MRYDPETGYFTDLTDGDLGEVIAWLERVRKNEFKPEPEWARACLSVYHLEDGGFIRNESDRRFYTATKMYQEVSLMVIRHLRKAQAN